MTLTSSFRLFRLACAALLASTSVSLQARILVESHPDQKDAPSGLFRREFDASGIKGDEHLVLLVAASDGAVISLNGKEVGRVNMPSGALDAHAQALAADAKKQGLFVRLKVPDGSLKPGAMNVLEADVRSAAGPHVACDLVLKTLPGSEPAPPPVGEARRVLEEFRRDNYIPPGTRLPDGYFDGGRHMKLDAADHATSGREILMVDRPHDPELTKELAYARTLREMPPLERARKLCLFVADMSTPPGGLKVLEPTVTELEHEFVNKPLRIGDMVDQSHAGVCRHRSLLFKLLADEAGLKTALVRGNYVHLHAGGSGPHAWNEIQLEDGRRYLVDSMLHPKDPFPEITSPGVTSLEVSRRYVKEDKTPFYKPARS